MILWPHDLTVFTAAAAGALLAAIWQGALLAGAVWLALRLLPGLNAAARSVIWLNVFILAGLLHMVPALTGSPAASGPHSSAIQLDPRWSFALAGAWFLLSLLRAIQLLIGAVHLHNLARRALPVSAGPELRALLSPRNGRAAELCISDEVARPSVLGFFRPRILMPPALFEALTPAELHQVVLHELEHLRRADDWTNLIQKCGLVFFPLNPVMLWIEHRLCAERELACDDRVISAGSRKSYALCLTRLAEFSILRRSFSLVLGAWERRPELLRRIERIIQQPGRTMARRPALAATGGLLSGALACALLLSHAPQFVSFVPSAPLAQASVLPTAGDLARELGGTPQFVKATLPSTSGHQPSSAPRTRNAVVKHPARRPSPGSLQAQLTQAPSPIPYDPSAPAARALDQRGMVALTAFRTFTAPRVVLAVSPDRRSATPIVVPATYAIVATPAGWVIIQI